MKSNISKFIVSLALPQFAGLIGTLFTSPAIPTWYRTIEKPYLNPPSWVFGPVWTVLFILMGIALYIVWKKPASQTRKVALQIFSIQLILNTLWSIIFFGMQNPQAAFVEIIALWITILITIIYFRKLSKPAAWLLVPYILWVSFASYLNYSIWILNS